MRPWALLAWIVVLGSCAAAFMAYRKQAAGEGGGEGGSKEKFETEDARRDGGGGGDDDDDEIVEVAAAYRRIKGASPSTSDVRRVMKAMRRGGRSASDVIRAEAEADARSEKEAQARAEAPALAEAEAPAARPAEARAAPPAPEAPAPRIPETLPAAPRRAGPLGEALDQGMLRRVEDELETIVTRVDGLLEEIHAARDRRVSGPLSQDYPMESFVPYQAV